MCGSLYSILKAPDQHIMQQKQKLQAIGAPNRRLRIASDAEQLIPPESQAPPKKAMAILRHSIAPLRAVRCARQPPAAAARSFSVSANRRGGGHGSESQFEPPSGWLWGIKPGEKPEPEGWEWPMYFFCGSFVVAGVALAFKPDTSVSTWALEEARRRLEAEGVLPDPTASQEKK
ncbi:hypothetical protein BBAD15_g10290 [Beauveria bassiana D1-5]|uniref:NADH dehydrogenase [ubiquinone] 1 beta subcomplex subunit 11, mitochondrial n=1 Tax=Beauveria bassiana D1-5 TaxID=1245745 RepID=A0A0A2V9A9_BEABA|nr:hypothetical protein BBAD15_g10290 [Beauveria bassiana D1-5]